MKRYIMAIILVLAMGAALCGCSERAVLSGNSSSAALSEEVSSDKQESAPSLEDDLSDISGDSESVAAAPEEVKTEQELFTEFWEESWFSEWVVGPDAQQYEWELRIIVSQYMQNRDADRGIPIKYAADEQTYNGKRAYYPVEDYINTTKAMFGVDVTYETASISDAGPEPGTMLVPIGYDVGYVRADIDMDSFSVTDDELQVEADCYWIEEEREFIYRLVYTFAIHPDNTYCRYQLLSVEKT